MNSIPADFDLSPLIGAELMQVCLGQYQVQLQFEKVDLSCHIEGGGKLSIESEGNSSELFHKTWRSSHGLERLVGMSISAWSRRDSYHFTVTFTSEEVLVFETHEGPHEDFTVLLGEIGFWVL